ncbi:hypothetical protein QYM36_008059 [Artemia franciscana]|uniref:Reverse transcriptase domain-containing protein n=1 Tax=Artemia franciscana TaxID=6661 RepID=A0AA88IP41_ARTSF|nr:hypothetical protein QYM36_008059 [Artemia franciscana]
MLRLGIMQPSSSPWCYPVVVAAKLNETIRFCLDFRGLNRVSKFDAYPIPQIDELLEQVRNKMVFSVLDLTKGYWQVEFTPESMEKTAFQTKFGFYEIRVLPFGVQMVPATFQHAMDKILTGISFLCKGEVLERIAAVDLHIRPDKCKFGLDEVQHLNHKVGNCQITLLESKVEAVKNFPEPITKKKVSIKSLPVFLKKVFEEKGTTNPFQDFKDSQQKDIELTRFLFLFFFFNSQVTNQADERIAYSELRDGLSYWRTKRKDSSDHSKLMVPEDYRSQLILQSHCSPRTPRKLVHRGRNKTAKILLTYFFWPYIYNQIKSELDSCSFRGSKAFEGYVVKVKSVTLLKCLR